MMCYVWYVSNQKVKRHRYDIWSINSAGIAGWPLTEVHQIHARRPDGQTPSTYFKYLVPGTSIHQHAPQQELTVTPLSIYLNGIICHL